MQTALLLRASTQVLGKRELSSANEKRLRLNLCRGYRPHQLLLYLSPSLFTTGLDPPATRALAFNHNKPGRSPPARLSSRTTFTCRLLFTPVPHTRRCAVPLKSNRRLFCILCMSRCLLAIQFSRASPPPGGSYAKDLDQSMDSRPTEYSHSGQ